MSCVNTNTEEFRKTARDLDVHPDNLEVILDSYQNTPGMENYVPSNTEIKAKLNGEPFEADVQTLKWYNDNFLYKPAVFANQTAAIEQAERYKEFLPDSAVKVYRDNKGNYVVSVGTPMMKGMPVAINNTMVDHYLDTIKESNPYHQVFSTIVDLVGKDNISVRQATVDEVQGDTSAAMYRSQSRDILFFPEKFSGYEYLSDSASPNEKSRFLFKILAHELVHQFAFDAVADGTLKTAAQQKFHDEINSLYVEAVQAVGAERAEQFYGFKNAQEFIAEALTDRHFQKELASIKSSKEGKSLWQKLIDAFKSVFNLTGTNIDGTILADILSATEEYMSEYKSSQAEKTAMEQAMEQEKALMDELFREQMEAEEANLNAPGYRSQTLDTAIKHKDNKRDLTQYYLMTVGKGDNLLYAVHIPATSTSTVEKQREFAEKHLKKIGLSDNWTVGEKVFDVNGGKVLYVGYRGPKRTATTQATNTITESFSQREREFLDYLDGIRPDLVQQVRDGLQDISELMQHEDEITTFYEPVENTQTDSDNKLFSRFDFVKLKTKENWRDLRGGEIVAILPQEAVDQITERVTKYMEHKKGGELYSDVMEYYFPEGEATTSTEILDKVINSSNDKTLVELAKLVKDNLNKEVHVSLSRSITSRGRHTSDDRVLIAPRAANGKTRAEGHHSASRTIVHELAHSITAEKIDTNPELRKSIAEVMGQLSDYMKQNNINQYIYALKNEKEFIAEFMSQPLFREALKQMPSQIDNKPSNLFQKILNIIKQALGIKPNTTLFHEADRVMNEVFNAEVGEVMEEAEVEDDSAPMETQDEVRNILATNDLSVNTPVTKIISGIQTGVDTIGLDVAAALGLDTGGTAPAGFLREHGIDSKDAETFKAMGVVEITPEQQAEYTNRTGRRDPYTARTELNVRNSDGTVYFSTSADKRGEMATHRAAREWNKPFLVNPSAAELREWIAQNNIKTLNVAGNRGSKLTNGSEITQTLVEAMTTPTAPEGNVQSGTQLDMRVQAFSGWFEGASNDLVGVVPDALLQKVGDYMLSNGEIPLTNAEAEEFLSYAEELHPEAYEDYYGEEKDINKVREENKEYLEKTASTTQQVDNLLDSNVLSATEVRHIAEQAVYWISDAITEYMNNPESLFNNFPEKRTLDDKGEWSEKNKKADIEKVSNIASRADLVNFIGVDKLVTLCKEKFNPENNDYEKRSTIKKAKAVYQNWDAVMLLASDAFLSVEDFSIVSSRDGKTKEVGEKSTIDVDNFNQSNEQGNVEELEGNLQEHWQVETKTLDVLSTMSQIVRQALNQCYQLRDTGQKDANGKPIYENVKSEFGINERVDARQATNSILRWTQGALDLAEMIQKLREKESANPWVSQIISRLEDNTGKEVDFQGQFFGTFLKHFQPYSVVIEEDGRYKSINVNENPALSDAMSSVTAQFRIGEHPLFSNDGIKKEKYKELQESYDEIGKFFTSGKNIETASAEERAEMAKTLGYVSTLLGFFVTPDLVEANLSQENLRAMQSSLRYIVDTLGRNLDNSMYDPFKFGKESINGNVRGFLRPIMETFEDIAVSAFYDSGKMYQSYITPSYTSKLFQKFSTKNPNFDQFITDEYGNYAWFKDPATDGELERGWRNEWLRQLATDEKAREVFKHKVQLNFNKKNYMRNMDDMEYTLSVITEYFSEAKSDKESRVPAWFRVPMLSNKPSSEFIRFYSERGANYRDVLTSGFLKIFSQELGRIQTVETRNLNKKDSNFIKNFDTNGRKFMFLDFMNDYLTGTQKNSELGKLIREKLDGKTIDDNALNTLAKEAIMTSMEERASRIVNGWLDQGLFKGVEKIANIDNANNDRIAEELKNFVWNDTFASMNIMQLTITDLAYYKDAEDLQKRLAQIHAPGIRGNVMATDYGTFDESGRMIEKPKPITDGKFRTIKLTDFDGVVSNIIDNVSIVFDRKIAKAPESEKAALRALKESLVGKDGAFRNINVADAQGYSSPSSYRKKALIFGKWSRQAEEVYQKLMKGEYNYNDLKVAFQPLKPFVYSQIEKAAGVDGVPMETLKVPVQFKNSEYLLIMADAILRGEETGKPNLLRAIYDVMEASHYDENGNYKTDGIDTVQFESTMKSGLSGKISLNDFVKAENGEAMAKARLEAMVYNSDGTYNNTSVDAVPFEDYCLQQEVPDHFKDHEQAHGSQIRYIIPSELEMGDAENLITYNLEGRQVSAQEFKAEYEQTIADNIEESINNLSTELGLDQAATVKDRNIALSRILQKEILSSPRYGVDLLQACTVDPETGKFRIPLGDPIQSKRVEQLINSIIKNRVNKQTIAGGPVVQVTNFGTSKELNIRFKNKNGGVLKTRTEWEANPEGKSFEDYIKENQGGIAYFEVFAPMYANDVFENFMNEDGSIDVEAIEATDPELLKMIGYRIPTEDKYSMAPLKIVGFLPREAGDGIMLPNDITLLTGSDFDVDKEYLMRKEIKVRRKSRKVINDALYELAMQSVSEQGAKPTMELKQTVSGWIKDFLDKVATGDRNFTTPNEKFLWKNYKRVAYETKAPKSGRTYRNNKIVDMTYEVLTHETSMDKMLNPGGFDQQKRMGYLVEAYKMVGDESKQGLRWEDMSKMSIDELKDLTTASKNLSFIDTHVQFYKQNSAAGSLIGIFAVNRIAHAVIESGSHDGGAMYQLNVDNICKINKPFSVGGVEFGGNMAFDMRYDRSGQLIGKVMGSLVAASVDAVKDPILNLMNINSNTANILNTLVRMGMPFDNAALFLSQSVIADVLAEFSRENITGFKSLSKIIQERIEKIEKDNGFDDASQINNEDFTVEEMVEGIKPNSRVELQYKALRALANFQKIAGAMRMPTFATRFNSISSAVGPLIIDNLIMEHKMDQLSEEGNVLDANGEPVDMTDIFRNHPILNQFQRTVGIARMLFGNMPANSNGFREILDSTADTSLENAIYGDRRVLSALSDFYQSYLVMRGGVVDPSKLNYYITQFPREFLEKNYKQQYPDNALIQAIKFGTDKSGRPTLQVDITGLDTQQKERLSSGWIDLHKTNPELSQQLFNYNFFRGGIGFSPKTFMSLVPIYVKERMPGYVDTFRVLPSIAPSVVMDQFVRNNWDNNRLVPRKKVTLHNLPDGTVEVTSKQDLTELDGTEYFKMKVNGTDKLFKSIIQTEGKAVYQEVSPLGSNRDYIEMSESHIESPLNAVAEAKVENVQTDLTQSEVEVTDDADVTDSKVSEDKTEKLLMDLLLIEGIRDTAEEVNQFINTQQQKMRSASDADKVRIERGTKKFLENRFKTLEIPYDEKLINEVYEKMNLC